MTLRGGRFRAGGGAGRCGRMSGTRRREEPPHAPQHAVANGGAGGRGSVWGKALRSDAAWHDKVGRRRRGVQGAPARRGSAGRAGPELRWGEEATPPGAGLGRGGARQGGWRVRGFRGPSGGGGDAGPVPAPAAGSAGPSRASAPLPPPRGRPGPSPAPSPGGRIASAGRPFRALALPESAASRSPRRLCTLLRPCRAGWSRRQRRLRPCRESSV